MDEALKIKVALADDDAGMRLVMRKLIARTNGFELVGEAENGKEMLAIVEKEHPQLVILDVEMPEMSGIECAKVLQDMDPRMILIFATAHETYMGEAFSVYAFDYLLKPFKIERVEQTFERARQRIVAPESGNTVIKPLRRDVPGRLMLKHKEGISFVDMQDILLIQRENRSTVLYTGDETKFVTSEALGDLEARLDPKLFFRCHKSYIVNLNHIDNITPYGRWTYIIRLKGTKNDALITHDKFEELEHMFS